MVPRLHLKPWAGMSCTWKQCLSDLRFRRNGTLFIRHLSGSPSVPTCSCVACANLGPRDGARPREGAPCARPCHSCPRLPLAARIEQKVLVLHGGLGPGVAWQKWGPTGRPFIAVALNVSYLLFTVLITCSLVVARPDENEHSVQMIYEHLRQVALRPGWLRTGRWRISHRLRGLWCPKSCILLLKEWRTGCTNSKLRRDGKTVFAYASVDRGGTANQSHVQQARGVGHVLTIRAPRFLAFLVKSDSSKVYNILWSDPLTHKP